MSTPSFHGLLAGAVIGLGAFGTGVPSFAEPPAFGRLVFGAPIEEVRAALPEAGWSVESAERHSARVTEIKAANFTTFADMSFAALVHEGRYDYGAGNCEARVELGRGMNLPPPVVIAFDEARIVARPTISFAHYQIAELPALPAAGVEVALTCHVVRETGHVRFCEPSAPASDAARPFVEAAKARARGYWLDLGDIDRDDPAGLTTQLVVRLAPSDRRQTDFTGAAARPLRDLRWRRAPTSADLMEVYPRRALNREQEASLTLTCRIEGDLSVVCGAARATDPAMLPVFESAAHRVAARMVAAETLADGSPAAGTVFALQVDFRIAK